jgi:competence protein ComEC
MLRASFLLFLACSLPGIAADLRIYAIDVEGGKATLYVAPSGQSMLVDAGYKGFGGRDAARIAAAAKDAGISRIDYLVVSHYHQDHIGGVPEVAAKIPITHFVDHGTNFETVKDVRAVYEAYLATRAGGSHIQVKAGDTLAVDGLRVDVIAASGQAIASPLHGGGRANASCGDFRKLTQDPGENARSIGLLISYGSFRVLDLGDLFWNQEYDLACPAAKFPAVSLYLTTHHGGKDSGTPQVLAAARPRAAIMNNGPSKGGAPDTFQTLRAAPGPPDLWQLHKSVEAGKEWNSPADRIANPGEACEGRWIRVTARKDGSFTVTNSRNGFEKAYR